MLYSQLLNIEKRVGSQLYVKCPFHDDSTASFTINEDTNEWYCHGCAEGGSEVEFISKYFDVNKDIASKAFEIWERKGTLPFPTLDYICQCYETLQKMPSELNILRSWGITDEVIKQYSIGWDDCRVTIPIISRTNEIVNVRKYLPPHRRVSGSNNPKVLNIPNCGENRFFPQDAFEPDTIVIVEGEKDCLAARSQGINAITATAGTSIPMKELARFKDKEVFVMTDSDVAGVKLANSYTKALNKIAKSIKQIRLPVKDYVDFYRENPLGNILDYVVEPKRDAINGSDGSTETTLLTRSEDTEKLNAWITLENMSVTGTDPQIFTVPTKLMPICRRETCDRACSIKALNMDIDVDIRTLVHFVQSPDRIQDTYLRKMFGCKDIISEPVEYINAQKIIFQESASFMDGLEESTFEHRYGIYLYQDERLSPTQKYDFECSRVTDPRTQQNYYVIRKAIPKDQILDVDVDLDSVAKYFKEMSKDIESFEDLLDKHYDVWMSSLNIEGRKDLLGAIILTYLSVTEINWRGGTLKGWLDTLVIGDTRTGKSQMAQRFVKTLQLGSYINGENARATGVIGGIQKMSDSWIITWGAIPMNDKGLLIIDEASGLTIDDIKDLSATRSSGAVTINKIVKGEARARTRLLWFSNPRSGRNIDEFYWKGYGAFTEFIPVVEDQARYDIVLSAARDDVPILNGFLDDETIKPPLDLWRILCKYAWSIPATEIVYDKALALKISETALELDSEYGGGPLVVGVAVHEKLIRLTSAIAIFCGSIDHKGKLILEPRHVDFAKQFLMMTYDKPSFDYKSYVSEHKRSQNKRKENTEYIRSIVAMYPALRVLLSSNIFRGSQLREVLGIEGAEASKMISNLLGKGLLKVTGSGAYAPDKLLIEIAKQMLEV